MRLGKSFITKRSPDALGLAKIDEDALVDHFYYSFAYIFNCVYSFDQFLFIRWSLSNGI